MRAQSPIDLHLHSNISDGTDSPELVVREAHAHGVRTMALTDHDIIDGWGEAEATCRELGMTFVPGMEVSTKGANVGGMHLMAYLFDPLDRDLIDVVVENRNAKTNVTRSIVESLQDEFDITWDEVLAEAQGATPQKPHIGKVMNNKGLVSSVDEFFATLMHHESPHYRSGPTLPLVEAIRLVRAAGGVPIIAHPTARNRFPGAMPEDRLVSLLEAGLAGFELDHPQNHANEFGLARLWEYQQKYDFIVTGSSDYHGSVKSNKPGQCTTSPEMFARIVAEATERGGISPVYPGDTAA